MRARGRLIPRVGRRGLLLGRLLLGSVAAVAATLILLLALPRDAQAWVRPLHPTPAGAPVLPRGRTARSIQPPRQQQQQQQQQQQPPLRQQQGLTTTTTSSSSSSTALFAKPPRRWGGVRRQIEGGDGEEGEGDAPTAGKAPQPRRQRPPTPPRRASSGGGSSSRPAARDDEDEEDAEADPLAITDDQIEEAMGRKARGIARPTTSGDGTGAALMHVGRGAEDGADVRFGGGGEPEQWSMEWLESLSEQEMLALDKRRLMEFLLRDIEGDKEWAAVPDEAVFAPEEEMDPKAEFYDEKLTEEVFGKMPPLPEGDDEDEDFDFDDNDEEDDVLADIFGDLDEEDEEEDDEDLMRFLGGSHTPEEVKAKLAALGVEHDESLAHDPRNDDEVRDDEEDEDIYDMGAHLRPGELGDDDNGSGGEGMRRLLAGLGKGARKAAADAGADPVALMAAVKACLENGDAHAASELLQRMEELGLEVGDLEGEADALLEGYRRPVQGQAKRRMIEQGPGEGSKPKAKQQPQGEEVPLSGGVLSEEAVAAMKAQGACVGIDLGTTNSALSLVKDGRAVILPSSATGANVVPSVVRYVDGGIVVGQAALDAALNDSDNTFASVKRLIGRSLEELVKEKEALGTVQLVEREPQAGEEEEDDDVEGQVAMWCPALQRSVTPEEVSAEVLRTLLADTAAYLGQPINRAVITVPAYFTPEQCAATERAGRMAGLQRVKLLREPEAAALAYGLDKLEDELILVFDLGGGTFDVSVLEVGDGILEVLATFGDNHLGGNDFDQRIVDFLVAEYKKQHGGQAPPSDRQTARRLLEAAERAKVRLTGATKTEIDLPGLGGPGKDLTAKLTRQQFEALCADLYDRLLVPIRQAALMAGATLSGEVPPDSLGSELVSMEYEDVDPDELIRRLEKGDRKAAGLLREQQLQGRQASKARASYNKQLSAVRKRNPGVKIREFPMGRPLSEVVMVGGATRMPAIQRLVEAVTGIKPRITVNPDEAVALGAGIHAGVLDGTISDVEMMTPMQAAIMRGLMEYEARGGGGADGERKGPQLKTGKRTGLF